MSLQVVYGNSITNPSWTKTASLSIGQPIAKLHILIRGNCVGTGLVTIYVDGERVEAFYGTGGVNIDVAYCNTATGWNRFVDCTYANALNKHVGTVEVRGAGVCFVDGLEVHAWATVSHLACVSGYCARQDGPRPPGVQECTQEGITCPAGGGHYACFNGECITVPGSGENTCVPNVPCVVHASCINGQCVQVPGPGPQACAPDCVPQPPEGDGIPTPILLLGAAAAVSIAAMAAIALSRRSN